MKDKKIRHTSCLRLTLFFLSKHKKPQQAGVKYI